MIEDTKMGNQEPLFEGLTIQWPKGKNKNPKHLVDKILHEVPKIEKHTRAALKNGGGCELTCSGMVSSSCSISCIRCVTFCYPAVCHE